MSIMRGEFWDEEFFLNILVRFNFWDFMIFEFVRFLVYGIYSVWC